MTNASSTSPLLTLQAARAKAKKRALLASSKSSWTRNDFAIRGGQK